MRIDGLVESFRPMTRRSHGLFAAVVVATVLLSVGAGIVASEGVTRGEPELNVYLPDNEVTPGSETTLDVQIQNDAEVDTGTRTEAVTTARAVRVEVTDEGPFDVRTRERPIGPIADGTVSTAEFRTIVPDDIEPGTYNLDVRIEYSVTNRVTSGSTQRLSRSETATVTVRVVDEPRFEVTDVETAVQPGTTGDAEITIENVGSATANDTRGTFRGGEGVDLDGGTAEAFIGDLDPGDERTVTVEAALEETVATGQKPIEASFEYRDGDGRQRETNAATGALATRPAQSFTVAAFEDTLSVGYDGVIRGTLRNDGPAPITDGVLLVEPTSDSLFIEERRYALPELDSGETTDFAFPTEVSGQADPGPRQVRLSIEYANGGRSTATVGPISERVVVDARRDEFSISTQNGTIPAGETATLVATITNERPETLSNIDARLYTDSPLSASDDEAFVDELGPGESATLRFDVTASGSATQKTYPVELDFQYDTETGESKLSDTYQQPLEVTEPTGGDGGLGFAPAVGALAVLLSLGGFGRWRRR